MLIGMDDLTERVRRIIYSRLAMTGTAPSPTDVAELLGVPLEAVEKSYDDLAEARHIVLGGGRDIVLAHPFATVNLGFSVMVEPPCSMPPALMFSANARNTAR